MDGALTLVTALGTAFGAGGVGILVASRGNWRRLRASTLTRRYLTWLALAVVYGVPLLFGAPGVTLLAAALAVQAAREAAPLLRLDGAYRWALFALCGALPPLFLAGAGGWAAGLVVAVALGLPVARGRADELEQGARLAFGALLLGWTLAHLVALRQAGPGWPLLALFGTAVSDVCAFTAGSLLGGPRLAPRLSPNKTWAGLTGNLLGAALALLLVAPLLPPLGGPRAVALVALVGLGGCLGDLGESLLKRSAGVKDAGGWLPGFGGLLDRIDSLLAVAPLLAALLAVGGR
ncbi:MAG TPA: phosphatidate cytidylyltransferase [Thermomicrobiales bacterium]|nr:phosphatidate cytidylyltransferase [Thermomicrobiales bacterium]